ncbi:YhcN/YlaJ family sporulation lipoprotein [Paenibacillus nasutitermitis]|uniref:YhcN/YlaJ family sporulation lipoprotein n=1 Tax=Paenibacillus nasutitermitis TaxID=1652958 RepID=A0A916Z3Q7_9BACL|nr:YhcN/YlaJ family sporulation lipoprotein [Paenibacillus nasutitermitis]GGD75478.1 hypothetical protein GCM10010911_36790 [Paenibacillus nasutitermitis]
MYKFGAIVVLSVSLAVVSTGCATRTNNNTKANNYRAQSTDNRSLMNESRGHMNEMNRSINGNQHLMDGTNHSMNGTHSMNNSAPNSQSANLTASERIAKRVSAINGVDKATVILNNRDAVVGVDLKQGANKAAVEKNIMQAVKRIEPKYAVHITTDKKLHTRIRTLHSQMVPLDGHPIRNLSEDIGTLIRDLGNTITAPLR